MVPTHAGNPKPNPKISHISCVVGIGIKFSFGFHAFEKVDDFGIIAEDLIFFSFCPLVFFLLLIAVTSGQVDFFAQHETWCKPMTSGLFAQHENWWKYVGQVGLGFRV